MWNPGPDGGEWGGRAGSRTALSWGLRVGIRQGRAGKGHQPTQGGRHRVARGCGDDVQSPWNRAWHTGAQPTPRSEGRASPWLPREKRAPQTP